MKELESLDADLLLIHAPKIFTTMHSKMQDNTLENNQKQSRNVEIFGIITSECCLDIPLDIFVKCFRENFTNYFLCQRKHVKVKVTGRKFESMVR